MNAISKEGFPAEIGYHLCKTDRDGADRNSFNINSRNPGALMLYLDRSKVSARWQTVDKRFCLGSKVYICDETYFGGWIPLRGPSYEIVGFKIVAWASDDYLARYVLPADFVRLGQNVKLEKTDERIYISILLTTQPSLHEDWNRIFEATIYRDRRNNFALRLNGTSDENWYTLNETTPTRFRKP
jgi:hypothetical protein